MLALSHPIIPPAPKVDDTDLPGWRVLFGFAHNAISIQPKRAFEETRSQKIYRIHRKTPR
jgi:hypothetical protein